LEKIALDKTTAKTWKTRNARFQSLTSLLLQNIRTRKNIIKIQVTY